MEEQKLVDELQFMNKNNNNKLTDYIQFSKQRTYINNFNESNCEMCKFNPNNVSDDDEKKSLQLAYLLQVEENEEMKKDDEYIAKMMMGDEGIDQYFGAKNAHGEELVQSLSYPLLSLDGAKNIKIFHSPEILSCWVPQTAYSCGATSVANVINSLQKNATNVKQRDEVTTQHLLNIYVQQNNGTLRNLILQFEKKYLEIKINDMFTSFKRTIFRKSKTTFYDYSKDELFELATDWLDDEDIEYNKEMLTKLKGILRVKRGLAKLQRKVSPGPHTSVVGNSSLMKAAEIAASKHTNINLNARIFISNSKKRPEQESWNMLKKSLQDKNSQIIFHLTNHYAPVYAAREYMLHGKLQRQILTSYAGQKPSAWIHWTDALKIINKWAGYKFMIFELVTNSKMKCKVGKHPHRMKLSN